MKPRHGARSIPAKPQESRDLLLSSYGSRRRFRSILALLVALPLYLSSCTAATQIRNVHAGEPIGTVQQLYDGALLPDLLVNTARNIDRLYPTRVVRRGRNAHPLPYRAEQLGNVRFTSDGQAHDLYDYIYFNRVSGLLILKNGEIAFETYQLGNTERTRWMSMSMVKSVLSALVGAAIRDGHIGSIDDQVTKYLPELEGSAYDGVTIRNALQMASGVEWNETYTDSSSDRRRMLEAQNSLRPGAVLELMASLPRAAEPGSRWNYSTGETHVVGALLNAATRQPLAEYLSERVWAKFGMESDATWWLEAVDGLEVGGSGLSATLRDYGRFGLFLLSGGRAGSEQVLPERWMDEATQARDVGGEVVDYGYLVWPVPASAGAIHHGAYEALGIFGQRLYVNPKEQVVIVVWAAASKPIPFEPVSAHDLFAAVCEALR